MGNDFLNGTLVPEVNIWISTTSAHNPFIRPVNIITRSSKDQHGNHHDTKHARGRSAELKNDVPDTAHPDITTQLPPTLPYCSAPASNDRHTCGQVPLVKGQGSGPGQHPPAEQDAPKRRKKRDRGGRMARSGAEWLLPRTTRTAREFGAFDLTVGLPVITAPLHITVEDLFTASLALHTRPGNRGRQPNLRNDFGVYVARSTTGTFLGDYTIGCAWWGYFWQASDYILVAEPQRELVKLEQRKQDSPPPPPIETQSVFERLRWALSLWLSPRCVGWSHESTSVLAPAPAPGTSRLRFLLGTQLPRGLALLLIHDAANLYTRVNPLFRAAGGPWESRGWGVRAGMALTFGASGWTGLALAWMAISVFAVGVGLSKPEEWPPLFGGPGEAYSVRRF
ncbi:unnamed protein product [Mycena citricolor]|uniref:Uncharacterized protein n=1 Tax=Mycena citricolor TaxID=2018698 RepID=A0AAD2K360_9AGAR|nr:unnamed protein product [Mycena citricolor]